MTQIEILKMRKISREMGKTLHETSDIWGPAERTEQRGFGVKGQAAVLVLRRYRKCKSGCGQRRAWKNRSSRKRRPRCSDMVKNGKRSGQGCPTVPEMNPQQGNHTKKKWITMQNHRKKNLNMKAQSAHGTVDQRDLLLGRDRGIQKHHLSKLKVK